MANPVASYIFELVFPARIYQSTRTGGAPGSGTWTAPVTIFDGTADARFATARTFSAGALSSTDPEGIVIQSDNNTIGGNSRLVFLGNGSPTTPIEIDFAGSVPPSISDDFWDTAQGGYSFGGAFYFIGDITTTTPMIRSADNGATWTVQDSAHGPITNNKAAVQRVNNLICICTFADNNVDLGIWEFDLTTNLWGAMFARLVAPPIADFNAFSNFTNGVFKFPSGDYLILYDSTTAGGRPVARLWTAASDTWGPELPLPIDGGSIANAVMDPGLDVVHIFTYEITIGKVTPVHYSIFTHSTGLITPSLFVIPQPVGSGSDGVNHCSIQNGLLFVPRDDFADFANGIWVGTLPAPTTLFKELLPVPGGEKNQISDFAINPGGINYVVGDTGTVNGGVAGYLATYQVTNVVNNAINAYSFTEGLGFGYIVGDQGTVNGGGFGTPAIYQVLAVDNGAIATDAINNPGAGYAVNDTGFVNGGSLSATYKVTGTGGGGSVTGLTLTNLGTGYAVAAGVATTRGGGQPGAGIGLTIDINSVSTTISQIVFIDLGAGYAIANNVGTTATTGVGAGFKINILSLFNGVTGLTIGYTGGGYSVNSNVATTTGGTQPGVGTGLTINVLSVIGNLPSCAYMMFPNGYVTPPLPSGLRRGMSILTAKQWATIREKHLRSHMPTDIYLDHEFPNAGFHVWPVPIGTPDIEFYFWAVLTQFAALDSQVQFPPGYYDALVYNLALMMTSAYGTAVPPALLAAAEEKKRVIQELNSQIISGSYHQSRTLMGPSIGDLKPVAVTPDPNRPPQPGSAPVVTEP